MPLAEERSDDEPALEARPFLVGDTKVSLPIVAGRAVVEICNTSDMMEKVEAPSVDQHYSDDACPCEGGVFAHIPVQSPRLKLCFRWSAAIGESVWKSCC